MTAVARRACGTHAAMVTAVTAIPSTTCPTPTVNTVATAPAIGTPMRRAQTPPGIPRAYAHDDPVATKIKTTWDGWSPPSAVTPTRSGATGPTAMRDITTGPGASAAGSWRTHKVSHGPNNPTVAIAPITSATQNPADPGTEARINETATDASSVHRPHGALARTMPTSPVSATTMIPPRTTTAAGWSNGFGSTANAAVPMMAEATARIPMARGRVTTMDEKAAAYCSGLLSTLPGILLNPTKARYRWMSGSSVE